MKHFLLIVAILFIGCTKTIEINSNADFRAYASGIWILKSGENVPHKLEFKYAKDLQSEYILKYHENGDMYTYSTPLGPDPIRFWIIFAQPRISDNGELIYYFTQNKYITYTLIGNDIHMVENSKYVDEPSKIGIYMKQIKSN